MGGYSTKEKKEKRYKPVHTKRLRGHKPRDLIIIYSKYEDLMPGDNITREELYIPQWIGTDYVNNKRGLSIAFDEVNICTYEEMAELGLRNINQKLAELGTRSIDHYCKSNRVFFFYHDRIMAINGINPLAKIYNKSKY